MKGKRIMAMILMLSVLLGVLPGTALGSETEKEGVCGENATWEICGDSLVIEGTGPMDFDSYYYEAPWTPWEEEIKVISIREGITEAWGFHTCKWVEYVEIPASLRSLSCEDFANAPYLWFFEVHEDNPVYTQKEGVLFTKDGKTLLRFPGGYKGLYRVPETVTTIGASAFAGSRTLVEVVLPEGVTEIGEEAFLNCFSLASVKLPQGLKAIRQRAFYQCNALQEADLPRGLTTIEGQAFHYTGLTHVEIPDSVVKYRGAFGFCNRLESLTVGKGVGSYLEDDYWCTPALKTVRVSADNPFYSCDEKGVLYDKGKSTLLGAPDAMEGAYCVAVGVKTIDGEAFSHCRNLRKVQLPSSVDCIGEQAFTGCRSLEEINIEKITWFGMAAFSDCVNLKEIQLPSQQPYLGEYAFSNCGLTRVEIPEGYQALSYGLFQSCGALKEVRIPHTVQTIEGGALQGTALERVSLPNGLTYLGGNAFADCGELKELLFPEGNAHFVTDTSGAVYNTDRTILYYVPRQAGDLFILPETLENICDYAFTGGTVRTVVIPGGLTDYEVLGQIRGKTIEKFIVADTNPAFGKDSQGALYNKELTHLLRLPTAFRGAYYGPEQLASAERDAFADCEGLTEIHVGKAFGDPDSQLPFMENVPKFLVSQDHPGYYNDEKGVLYSRDGTRLIYAPKDLEGDYAIAETVTEISPSAFRGCRKLTGVDMESCIWLEGIPESAFEGCTALEEVRLPAYVLKEVDGFASLSTGTTIEVGDYAFLGCTALKKLEVPGSISRLGTCAFGECVALEEVLLSGSLVEMAQVFYGCEALRRVRFLGDGPLCDPNSFSVYHKETSCDYLIPNLTIEYENHGVGFTTPYWMSIPTRVFAEGALNCLGEDCTCTHFTDVPEVGHWAHNAIEELLDIGLFQGVGHNRFNPDGVMTRAMLVTILYRSAGEPQGGACPFTDVPADTWYTDAVIWAAEEGIVKGVGNGLFAPEKPVTREQVATILARSSSIDYEGSGRDLGWLGYFTDGDAVSDYARRPMELMVGMGVINGKGTGLDPQGTATRGEVATILWRWNHQ